MENEIIGRKVEIKGRKIYENKELHIKYCNNNKFKKQNAVT